MTAPARTWDAMPAAEKADRVGSLAKAGASYEAIACELGAPSRSTVAGVIARMRKAGETAPSGAIKSLSIKATRKRGGITGGKPGKSLREARAHSMLPQNIANKAESRKNDPGLPVTISRAAAWDALDGDKPVTIEQLNNRTCRWPVWDEPDEPHLYCGAPCEIERSYCPAHRQLSYVPPRIRAGVLADA